MNLAFILGSIFLIDILNCNGQTASTIPTPSTTTMKMTTTPEPLDAGNGGKFGNPGALFRLSEKALDDVYANAIQKISQAIRSLAIPDVIVPIGGGMLSIKNTRVNEAKFGGYEWRLIPTNRIRSRLHSARLVSIGQWQYRPFNGPNRNVGGGLFRTVVVNGELNVTNQFGRTWDAKPTVQTSDCKAYLGEFRVEIEGFGDNTTVIDKCDNYMCKRIRSYFEDTICNVVRGFIKDVINQKLSTAPTRIPLGPQSNRFSLDYGLLLNEPKVTDGFIQGYLEGEVHSRGSVAAPFYANDLFMSDDHDDKQSIITFLLSDYVFNTLLHHAHVQQYRFSAYDLLAPSQIRDQLKLQCPAQSVRPSPKTRPIGNGGARQLAPVCLGSVFDNVTIGQSDGLGDLIFKSQRPLQVILDSNSTAFGVNGGMVEAYGAVGSDGNGKRELLGRAEIQWIRGTFSPKMCDCNITGVPTITQLKFAPSASVLSHITPRRRSMSDDMLNKLAQLAIPVLTETFKTFFAQFAQFPIPLIDGYTCDKPSLTWMQHTMHVDTNVCALAEATRGKQ